MHSHCTHNALHFPLQYDHIGDQDGKVIYLDQDIDVQWYARQCTRFLRKIQVPGNLGFENTVQGVPTSLSYLLIG